MGNNNLSLKSKMLFPVVLLLFIFSFTSVNAIPSSINETLLNNLTAYYSFNENDNLNIIYDDLHNFNGINNNSILNNAGKLNKGYIFNGTNSINIQDLNNELNNNFTISYWEKLLTNKSSANSSWFISGSPSNTHCIVYYPELFCYINGNNYNRYIDGLIVGEWYNIIITYNSTDYKMYINGLQNYSGTQNIYYEGGINTDSFTPFLIGNNLDYQHGFNGFLDEFGIWNRNLNDSEVLQLYNSYNITEIPEIHKQSILGLWGANLFSGAVPIWVAIMISLGICFGIAYKFGLFKGGLK